MWKDDTEADYFKEPGYVKINPHVCQAVKENHTGGSFSCNQTQPNWPLLSI